MKKLSLDYGVLTLTIILLTLFPLLFKPWVHGADTIGYFSWLHSVVIDGDLQTADEFEHYGMGWLNGFTETGLRNNPGAVGSALLWSPWFLVAHGITWVGRIAGMNWTPNGYSEQYILAISLGSTIHAFLGLLITYYLARDFVSQKIATLAVATTWLASTLIFYMYSHPFMSHANDMFTYALFLWAWYRTRHNRNASQYVLLGLIGGLCALVRNQNAVLVLFPLAEILFRTIQLARQNAWQSALRQGFAQAFSFSIAWWLAFSPQVIVWRIVFGDWLSINPYADSGGGFFDWLHPRLIDVLVSDNHALFVWTPLITFAVLGWFVLWRLNRGLTGLVVINFLLQLYVIASWSSWDGSASFGQRFFTNMVPAFVLGLGALMQTRRARISFRWLVAGGVFFVVWNGLLIVRYALNDVERAGSMPIDQFFIGQFTILPRQFGRIIQILFTRQ